MNAHLMFSRSLIYLYKSHVTQLLYISYVPFYIVETLVPVYISVSAKL